MQSSKMAIGAKLTLVLSIVGFLFLAAESDKLRRTGEEEHPYVFKEKHFTTRVESEHGRVIRLQNFADRSELLRGIHNYRVAILEADPHTFIAPAHFDAASLFYVSMGLATVKMVLENRLESFNVKQGDLINVPAGTPTYLINRDENQKLYIVKFIQPVAVPGDFEAFVWTGGENPESFYKAFSTDLLEAALNVPSDRLEELFRHQKKGFFSKASKEQIDALSRGEEGRGLWPFETHESKSTYNILRKTPSKSNQHGRLHEIDSSDFRPLRDLDISVSFANITRGSMVGPFYNSKAIKIAVVIQGEGHLQMACPHLSSSKSSKEGSQSERGSEGEGGSKGTDGGSRHHRGQGPVYQQVRASLSPGDVYIVPAGHPVAVVASGSGSQRRRGGGSSSTNDQNLCIVCFNVNAQGNVRYLLAGRNNVISEFEKDAKELGFDTSAKEVDGVFNKQKGELFFEGPKQQQKASQ